MLRFILLVGVLMVGVVRCAVRCPDRYWQDADGTQCLHTSFDISMTLEEAELYCVRLQGRLFLPTGESTAMLKAYAEDAYLPNPDRWQRYWVGLTKALSDAWRRNVVLEQGPYCVALDYRRPINAQQVSFYGYDSPSCRTDVQLPAICSVDPLSEIAVRADPVEIVCPEPQPCPELNCPPPVECPVLECPAVEPCPPLPPASLSSGCPDTWFTRRGFCYHFMIAGKTWEAASASCGNDGADLVSILDQEENDFLGVISDELSDARPTMRRFWVGLTDRQQEGQMVWTSGAAVSFTSWGPRQPSIHKKRRYEENCVVINSQNVGLWDDIPCWRRHPFICKKAAR